MADRQTITLIDPKGLASEAYADDVEALLGAGYRLPQSTAELSDALHRRDLTKSESGFGGAVAAGGGGPVRLGIWMDTTRSLIVAVIEVGESMVALMLSAPTINAICESIYG